MSNFVAHPKAGELVKIHGKIVGYSRTRQEGSFVFTSRDQNAMGIIAVAAAVAGLSGPAISTAANASSMDEEADYVQFMLDGQSCKGWLWRSPFKEGDIVDVAGQWQLDHYEIYGMARPADKTVALYPHCSRGRMAHFKNAFFWWFWLGVVAQSIAMAGLTLFSMGVRGLSIPYFWMAIAGLATFFAVMFTSLTWKWIPFVTIAEKVFRVLGLPSSSSVDLVKSSKEQRTDKDAAEFGTFYFRY